MGSYQLWRSAIDKGEIRRVTWVCGDQPVLIEEVIDTMKDKLNVSDLDYVSLSFCSTFERDVWAAANQYPLTPGANRMILVRDADKLTRWGQLEAWMSRTRSLPGVYLVFVSSEPDLPTSTSGGRKHLKPHVAQLKAPRGSLVKCTLPTADDTMAWVRRRAPLDENTAHYLLTRTGGNLSAAAAVCAKLTLFAEKPGAAAINALVAETPADDLTENLIALDKRRALLCVAGLDHSEQIKLIALLDSRLDLLERLNSIQMAGQTWRDATGISPFLLRQYMPHARHYDARSCTQRRRVLAVLDDALRNGARVGILEALVALW